MARVMACARAIARIKWIRLTNRSIMQQNLFQNFLPQEAAAFGTAKATPKIEKTCILHIYKEYFICLQSKASGNFLH